MKNLKLIIYDICFFIFCLPALFNPVFYVFIFLLKTDTYIKLARKIIQYYIVFSWFIILLIIIHLCNGK